MLVLSVLTALIGVLMAIWPDMSFSLLLFWGIILLVSSYYVRRYELTLAMAAGLILIFFGQGPEQLLLMALLMAPVFVMALLNCGRGGGSGSSAARGKSYGAVRRWGVIAAVLAGIIYSSLGITGLSQESYAALVTATEIEIDEVFAAPEMQALWSAYAQRGIDKAAMQETIRQSLPVMIRLLPALMALIFSVFALMCLTLGRLFLRVRVQNAWDKPPFYCEVMPRPLFAVLLAGLALIWWGMGRENTAFYGGCNLLLLCFPLAVYYGLAVFSRRLLNVSSGLRLLAIALLTLLILFLTPLVLPVLAIMGLSSALFYKKDGRRYDGKEMEGESI